MRSFGRKNGDRKDFTDRNDRADENDLHEAEQGKKAEQQAVDFFTKSFANPIG